MKKEYIFLSAIIVALCAYLFLHKSGERHYTMPEIETVKASDIKRFEIDKKESTITIVKKDGEWMVSDKNYPADGEKVKKMAEAVEGLQLTALVSERENFKRYGLDKQNRIRVLAAAESEKSTLVMVGKVAPTRNHTFVKLEGDDRIYHAAGNLERLFDRSVSEIRDKQVMKLDKSVISGLKIRSRGNTIDLKRSETENGAAGAWKSSETADVDEKAVNSLLSRLSDLSCSSFPERKKGSDYTKDPALVTIELDGAQSGRIELFEKTGQGFYPGKSSQNQYPFLLKDFTAENILSDTDAILGIDRERSNGKDS